MGHSSASGRSLEVFGGRGQVLIDYFKGTDLDTTSGKNLRGTFSRFVMIKYTIEKDRTGKSSRGKSSQYIGRPH